MIRSVLNIAKKMDLFDTEKLPYHERTLLMDLVDILYPFEETTDSDTKHHVCRLHHTMYTWLES